MTPLQAARAAINRLETALLEPPLSFNHIVFPGFNSVRRPLSDSLLWNSRRGLVFRLKGGRVLAKEGDACARL